MCVLGEGRDEPPHQRGCCTVLIRQKAGFSGGGPRLPCIKEACIGFTKATRLVYFLPYSDWGKPRKESAKGG